MTTQKSLCYLLFLPYHRGYRYNVVYYSTILYTALQWLRQKINGLEEINYIGSKITLIKQRKCRHHYPPTREKQACEVFLIGLKLPPSNCKQLYVNDQGRVAWWWQANSVLLAPRKRNWYILYRMSMLWCLEIRFVADKLVMIMKLSTKWA